MKPVKSSNIAAIGYDPQTLTMEVQFHNGAIYRYHPISPETYRGLESAPSIGKHFRNHIMDSCPYVKLRPPTKR